jgi:hypothetical protein
MNTRYIFGKDRTTFYKGTSKEAKKASTITMVDS